MATKIGVPQTDVNVASAGTDAWFPVNGYAGTDDTNYDYCRNLLTGTVLSNYLSLTNFTEIPDIPAHATINSITLDLTRLRQGFATNLVQDYLIQYLLNGVLSGANKADVVTDWGSEATVQYVWNTGMPIRDQVVASTFGIAIQAFLTNYDQADGIVEADVDLVTVTVDYTEFVYTGQVILMGEI